MTKYDSFVGQVSKKKKQQKTKNHFITSCIKHWEVTSSEKKEVFQHKIPKF